MKLWVKQVWIELCLKKQVLQKLWQAACTELFDVGLARIVNKKAAAETQPDAQNPKKWPSDEIGKVDSTEDKKPRGRGRGGRRSSQKGWRRLATCYCRRRTQLTTRLWLLKDQDGGFPWIGSSKMDPNILILATGAGPQGPCCRELFNLRRHCYGPLWLWWGLFYGPLFCVWYILGNVLGSWLGAMLHRKIFGDLSLHLLLFWLLFLSFLL